MNGGLYIAVFRLDMEMDIQIGALGTFHFTPGYYLYVGSARRNMDSRLKRHASHSKSLRWHIDYFSICSEMIGAVILEDPAIGECELAGFLTSIYQRIIPGFGASDCRCDGHLFYGKYL